MAKDRLSLHNKLIEILGSNHVYFQPPSSIRLNYPCIIYKRDAEDPFYADDIKYYGMKRYMITVIDADPDSLIPDKVSKMQYCGFLNNLAIDGLNHTIYSLFY
jgi:hypothetical protein